VLTSKAVGILNVRSTSITHWCYCRENWNLDC